MIIPSQFELSKRTGIPLVATNDAHYLHREDAQAHDVLLCIGSGKKVSDADRLRFDTTEQPEFDRWRWAEYWTPVREVVYFKRRVYVRALHELGALLFPDGLPPYPNWWAEIEPP